MDWGIRVVMFAFIGLFVYKAASGGLDVDADGNGKLDTDDAYAFVDANDDGAISLGEGTMVFVWAFLAYLVATAVFNVFRSLGGPRS